MITDFLIVYLSIGSVFTGVILLALWAGRNTSNGRKAIGVPYFPVKLLVFILIWPYAVYNFLTTQLKQEDVN